MSQRDIWLILLIAGTFLTAILGIIVLWPVVVRPHKHERVKRSRVVAGIILFGLMFTFECISVYLVALTTAVPLRLPPLLRALPVLFLCGFTLATFIIASISGLQLLRIKLPPWIRGIFRNSD